MVTGERAPQPMRWDAVDRLLAWGFPPEDIATILNVPLAVVRRMGVRRALARADDREDHIRVGKDHLT